MKSLISKVPFGAEVAHSVEQRTENPRVGGSIPSLGTLLYPQYPGSISRN